MSHDVCHMIGAAQLELAAELARTTYETFVCGFIRADG